MLELDGANGGGQLLRSALTLSLCTGTGFTMQGIRARRSRPGLLRQHLTAVQAACAISDARVHGATLGSTSLRFEPGRVRAGDYRFAIGTAGSTTLVLQTVLPALWQADAPSRIDLEGGTHNPAAPTADFISQVYLPALRRMGVQADIELHQHGFYPAGGGSVSVRVEPCAAMSTATFDDRGALVGVDATVLLSALSSTIGRRELDVLGKRLSLGEDRLVLRSVRPAIGPGNTVMVRVEHAHHVELVTGHGERGVSAERVAEGVAEAVRAYIASDACVGEHLADQLLLPMALAGGGAFVTCAASDHLRSNAALIEKFVAVDIGCEPIGDRQWRVSVER